MSTSTAQQDLSQNPIPDTQKHAFHARKRKNPTTLPQDVTFPFVWQYGKVVKLSEEEKAKINQPRGKKNQYKPCTLCGRNGGSLTHRKTCDGFPSLICGSCAINYVLSAINLQEK